MGLTRPPITKGIQNHVRFLKSRKACISVRMQKTTQAIALPAVDGVYSHNLYLDLPESDMASVCCGRLLRGAKG
jgi:hypothetical protein